MASFNWLPWNQIVLFDEQSRGDTCGRICRRGTFLLQGRGGGAFLPVRIFGESKEQAATEGVFQRDFGGEIFWLREQAAEGGFSWLFNRDFEAF